MYRKLKPNETVMHGDEVLNEFGEKDWTLSHGYCGDKVKYCTGAATGNQRVFRRVEIDKKPFWRFWR